MSEAAGRAVAAGLAAVAGALDRLGRWPSRRHGREDRADHGRPEFAPFVTATGLLALRSVGGPSAAAVRRRSAAHLAATILPPGAWRYYRDAPVDMDDTSLCALALDGDHPLLRAGGAVGVALGCLRDDGRFGTWQAGAGPRLDVDATVNANVLALVGPRAEGRRAARWVAQVVEQGAEARATWYYRDPLDLHEAVQRAADRGVRDLLPAARRAAGCAAARLAEPLEPHRLAQAMCVAAWGEPPHGPGPPGAALQDAALRLIAAQRPDGTWDPGLMYVGPVPPGAPTLWYASRAVTTARCVAALASAGRAALEDPRHAT